MAILANSWYKFKKFTFSNKYFSGIIILENALTQPKEVKPNEPSSVSFCAVDYISSSIRC